jgi:Arylsulfotransferase (ASST)
VIALAALLAAAAPAFATAAAAPALAPPAAHAAVALALATAPARAAAALALAPAAARAAAAPALPHVTISPLDGTPDASPTTQISFLGVPAADISQVSVRGSSSGSHRGRLEPYSTGTGVSYQPLRPLTPHETVKVSAVETISGRHQTIGTTFTVAEEFAIPPSLYLKPTATVAPAGTVASLLSLPSVRAPVSTITATAADPTLGDIFLTPAGGGAQAGPMIVSPSGQLVWFSPEPPGIQAEDLRVQQYQGQTVLTYWQGRIVLGHGAGSGVIDNTAYQPIAHVAAGNGLAMDLHDFDLEPDGTALITVYDPIHFDLHGHGGRANGVLEDCVVQQIDVKTGLVMFEWHALGHVPLTDSHAAPRIAVDRTSDVWDWFHINSIFGETDGNLLISSRNTWAVYQIGRSFGEVLWRLGGRHTSFTLGPGVRFAWQHDATLLPDGTIEIFDNEATPAIASQSRGIDVSIDLQTHTATLLHQYLNPGQAVLSASQGDVQQLANGDQLIGWGQIGLVTELSPAAALTFQLKLPVNVESYRAYRFPWAAQPASPPVVTATPGAAGAGTTTVAASWDGATAVASWQVMAGATPTTLVAVGTPVASAGFETQIVAATTAPYVGVQALDANGAVLAQATPAAVSAA